MKPDRSGNYIALQLKYVPVYSNMEKAKGVCFILLDLFVLFFPCVRVLHPCVLDNTSWPSNACWPPVARLRPGLNEI